MSILSTGCSATRRANARSREIGDGAFHRRVLAAVVNIFAQAGVNRLADGTSKPSVVLIPAIAVTLTAPGIRADAITPGMIRTPMTETQGEVGRAGA
jgi:NAD(P)-dependent dehydrogenase (short-subunit alcohol dehydrogenase family)